ncbi:MAG TPA: hypothetical protein VGH98_07225 [Gemmatimonadaceae bacterium]|jgi:hypothetical protein
MIFRQVVDRLGRPAHSICSRVRPFPPASAESALPPSVNEPFIEAIVERIRDVVARQSADSLDAFATTLVVPLGEFRTLINDREQSIDALFLIEVVAAFVHEFAVDPEWLLTGHYNLATHREALLMVEDRSVTGARTLRDFVHEHFERLRSAATYLSLPPTRASQ